MPHHSACLDQHSDSSFELIDPIASLSRRNSEGRSFDKKRPDDLYLLVSYRIMSQGGGENVQAKKYTVADLKAHTSESSCFLLVHGKVHDVTEFLDEHPGGMHPHP